MTALALFHKEIIEMYGYYVQVRAAISRYHSFLSDLVVGPGPTTGSNDLFFAPVDPNRPDARYRYRRTLGDLIEASGRNGILEVTHRRSVVVLIVASWEETYRERIAKELGLSDKNDVKSDAFRDLNRLRNAILHTGNELRDGLRAIRLFEVGEQVSLTHEHVDYIFEALVDALNRIGRDYYRRDPQFNFETPLHN